MSDVHKHRCKQCGTIWQHDRELIPSGELEKAHECPRCGDYNSRRYYGDSPVSEEFPEIVAAIRGIVGEIETIVEGEIVEGKTL